MISIEVILLNLIEIRRRSELLWAGIPAIFYFWRPDANAMHCLEMVRHVLESEHLFHVIVNNRGNLGDYVSPWENRPFTDLHDELAFAAPYREAFLETVKSFCSGDLKHVEIIRTEKGQRRCLGDYLLRIAYHESVHAGQMLSYLRTLGLDRPLIWD